MLYATLKVLHLLAVVAWVGGMLFVQFFLRPSLGVLEPPQRLRLMHEVLQRFFGAMALVVLVALLTGGVMIGEVHQRVAETGGRLVMPLAWTVMSALGLVMAAIFGHLRFALFRRLQRAVAAADSPAAAAALAQIRRWVMVNLVLGLAVIVVATAGGAG